MENKNTARNFALQLGSLITLYVSVSAMVLVLFGVITTLYPDALNGSWEYQSAQQSIRFGIAMLVVFFPTYVFITRSVNEIRRNETGTYMALTKWLVYLSLLVGGVILLGDAVTVILTYLNGEITVRFILKALALLIIVGSAFYYYILDAKLYWITHESQSKLYALVVSIAVIAILALGFSYSDTPKEVREKATDELQTQNLQDMQWRIVDHYRINKSLPTDTAQLYVGIQEVAAPQGRAAYTYKVIDEDTYKLCATYLYPSQVQVGRDMAVPVSTSPDMLTNPYNNWDHGVGETCFERTIMKENFPQVKI